MSEQKFNTPPLLIWGGFGIVGGFLGALNPAWYLLKPSHKEHVVSNYGLDYANFASGSASFYISMLLIPAFLSTICLFPFFYKILKDQMKSQKIGFLKNIVNGFLFGIAASFPTAFFFMLHALIFNHFNGYMDFNNPIEIFGAMLALAAGPMLLAPVGIAISLPAMLVSGWFFSTLTVLAIKKEQKVTTA